MKISTKTMAIGGVFTALVTLGTMVIRIPIPAGGYIHIGDSLVYLSGILLGPVLGGFASGIGSMIADLIGGYGIYAPATAIIKFFDAFLTALVFFGIQKQFKGLKGTVIGYIAGVFVGAMTMVGGYFNYELILYGMEYALGSVSFNVVQAIGGAIIGLPVLLALEKTKYFSRLNTFFKQQ